MIPLFILVPYLCKRFRKRNLFMIGTLVHIIPAAVFLIVGVNAGSYRGLVDAMYILFTLMTYFCNILAFMMLPDCVDYGHKLTGIVSAALVTATFTFVTKFSEAIGGMLTAGILGWIGYEADAAFYPRIVLWGMVLCLSLPTILADLCAFVSMKRYPINERQGASATGE